MKSAIKEALIVYEEFQRILTDAVTGPNKKYKSVRHAARAANISHTTIYHLMQGLDDPTPKLLAALSVAFPERASELWLSAWHTPPLTEDVDAPDSPREWTANGEDLEYDGILMGRCIGSNTANGIAAALNEYEAMKRALALVPGNPLPPQKTDPLPDGRHWCVNGCDAHFVSDSDTGCSVCSVACSRGLCHMACRLCNSREQSEAINGLLTLAAKFAEEREGEG